MTDYLSGALAPPTQQEAAPGTVENSAGGQSFAVDEWQRLNRFLVLGSEGGSYYAGERQLTMENVKTLRKLIVDDGTRFVATVVDVSQAGRAPKNDPAILALALAASVGDEQTRARALRALPDVCRIGTHLFTFLEFAEQLRGWGRGLRRAVADWYLDKDVDRLAYQLVKYRQRNGWTHRDALRLSHPRAQNDQQAALLKFAADKGDDEARAASRHVLFFGEAQRAETPARTAELVRLAEGRLSREMLKTEHLTDPDVWQALLDVGMPMTAMIRNLGNMTRIGLLKPGSAATKQVLSALADEERIRKARVHPIAVLMALRTYASAGGWRSSKTWNPVPSVIDALDSAFYLAFGNVESTGKRFLLGLDVSGSMGGGEVGGVPGLTPRDASAAMALVTAATEPAFQAFGFASGNRPSQWYGGYGTSFEPLAITPKQRLDDAIRTVSRMDFGGTDCALPMIHARDESMEVDAFVIYTDSETWTGDVHPDEALRQYRRASGIDAKLVVVGMVSNGFSIANPNDPGMLDVVGFDTATPNVISEFVR